MTTTNESLQAQIVALRAQIEAIGPAQAAVMEHIVRKTVLQEIGDRLPTEEHTRWLAQQYDDAQARRQARNELAMHLLKLGTAGVIGFMLWAMWEGLRAKITGKPPFGQ
jgi:hypothetical protein